MEDSSSNRTPWQEEEEEIGQVEGAHQLYESHIPTSKMQKVLLTAGSALMALYDPTRAGRSYHLIIKINHLIASTMRNNNHSFDIELTYIPGCCLLPTECFTPW